MRNVQAVEFLLKKNYYVHKRKKKKKNPSLKPVTIRLPCEHTRKLPVPTSFAFQKK